MELAPAGMAAVSAGWPVSGTNAPPIDYDGIGGSFGGDGEVSGGRGA